MSKMPRPLIVKQLHYDLTPVAGLALVGHYLHAVGPVLGRVDAALPVKGGVLNSDILRSYLGLLVQGKSDFDAIENFRGEVFYKQALGIALLPSSPTLRQRMDARAAGLFDFIAPMIETLLGSQQPDYGVLPCGWLPLDVDTFAMDNGGTAKEGVDSGFDSARLMREIESCNQAGRLQVDWLIKWNPRAADVAALAARLDAEAATPWEQPRKGKRVTTWEQAVQVQGIERPVRRVFRLIERTIDKRGQALLVPELTLEGWTTSLPASLDAQAVIALYADHGTHEQFHSEFKTDLDLTRLPSGKFDTNYLVCQLAALAMNILRLMGQRGLLGPDAPVRHSAKRRRIKTVMQELIYRAGRLIQSGRRLILGLGAHDRAAQVFMHSFAQSAASA